jgi:hypothetical protein
MAEPTISTIPPPEIGPLDGIRKNISNGVAKEKYSLLETVVPLIGSVIETTNLPSTCLGATHSTLDNPSTRPAVATPPKLHSTAELKGNPDPKTVTTVPPLDGPSEGNSDQSAMEAW